MNKSAFFLLFTITMYFPVVIMAMEEQDGQDSEDTEALSEIGIVFGEDSDCVYRPDEIRERMLTHIPHYNLENGLRSIAIGPKKLVKTLEYLYRNGQVAITDAPVVMPPRRSATSQIVPMSIKEFISYKKLLAQRKVDLENKIGNFKRKRKETLKKEISVSTLLVTSGIYYVASENIKANHISLFPYFCKVGVFGGLCTLPYKFVYDIILNSDKFRKKECRMEGKKLTGIEAMNKIIETHENGVSLSTEQENLLEGMSNDETLTQFKERIKYDVHARETPLLRFALRDGGLANTIATLYAQKKLKIVSSLPFLNLSAQEDKGDVLWLTAQEFLAQKSSFEQKLAVIRAKRTAMNEDYAAVFKNMKVLGGLVVSMGIACSVADKQLRGEHYVIRCINKMNGIMAWAVFCVGVGALYVHLGDRNDLNFEDAKLQKKEMRMQSVLEKMKEVNELEHSKSKRLLIPGIQKSRLSSKFRSPLLSHINNLK